MAGDPQDDTAKGPALVRVRSDRVVLGGMALWVLALVVILAVPELRSGDRAWWPWACVAGLALGGLGWVYLRRGRGNAADADAPVRVPDKVKRRG